MDHAVRRRGASPQAVDVLEIASVHLGPGRGERRGRRVRLGEAEHRVARGDEILNDGGTDKATSATNENTHQGLSLICLEDRNPSPLGHRVSD